MVDIIIEGGQVVTPAGVGIFDVAIHGEKIVAVTEPGGLDLEAGKRIDASGNIVIPGGIEPHAHIGGPRQPERSGAEPVSLAAIYGGTTTVLDFANQVPGHDLHHALGEAADRWRGNAYTDYSYHPIFTRGAEDHVIGQIGELTQDGYASFKVFTTSIRPPSPQMQDNKTDFGRLSAIMDQVASSGSILMIHSEDDDMVMYNYDHAKEWDWWDWWNMHHVHSNLSEDVSFRRAIRLAEQKRCPVYFVHVSAGEGVRAVTETRTAGYAIYGETLHNYACFNAENYREEYGMKYHTYPSLKSPEDADSLWQGLLDGRLSTSCDRPCVHHLGREDALQDCRRCYGRAQRHRDACWHRVHRGSGAARYVAATLRGHHFHECRQDNGLVSAQGYHRRRQRRRHRHSRSDHQGRAVP